MHIGPLRASATGPGPTGNRRTLGLLVNDDATCYLALVHGSRNQHWQGKSKQSNL